MTTPSHEHDRPPDGALDDGERRPAPELLGLPAAVGQSDEQLQTPPTQPWRSVAATGAVLAAAAVLLWTLARAPEPAEDGTGDPTTTQTTASTLPPSTTTTAGPTTLPPGSFLMGEGVDLWLFYGGGDALQRLDLDNGAHDRFGLRAHPIAATGDHLVLSLDTSGDVGWVDLALPSSQADGWLPAKVATADEDGSLWLLRTGRRLGWSLFELNDSTVVDRRSSLDLSVPESGLDGRLGVIVSGPDLVATPSGIYRSVDGDVERVGSGDVITYDEERVLIESCGADLDTCTHSFVDRATLAPIDLPVPNIGRLRFGEILGGGRWLHAVAAGEDGGGNDQQAVLISLENDTTIELAGGGEMISISSNGRWLARSVLEPRGVVELIDLTTGDTVHRFDASGSRGGSVLLVDKSRLATGDPSEPGQ